MKSKTWFKRLVAALVVSAFLGFGALEVIRFVALRAGVRAVQLPAGSQIRSLAAGADYVDAYEAPLDCSGLTIDEVLPEARPSEAARTFNEVVYRGTAPGLFYYASYLLEQSAAETVTLSTTVFYESVLGMVYFTPVKQVHRRAVPLAVSRLAKRWCEAQGE